jgi:hypothetical protein
MRWPFIGFTKRGTRVPQVPPVPASLPSTTAASGRPATALELVSDLASDFKKALTFVFLVSSLLVVFAACVAGDCFAIMAAARELKGIPVPTTVSVGVSGASGLTLVVALVTRWIRNLAKGAERTGSSGPPNGTAP